MKRSDGNSPFTSNPMNHGMSPKAPNSNRNVQMNDMESGNTINPVNSFERTAPQVSDLKPYPNLFSYDYWSYCSNPEPGLVLDGITHKGKFSLLNVSIANILVSH